MNATRHLAFVGVLLLLICGTFAQVPTGAALDYLMASLQSGEPARIQEAVDGLSRSGSAVVPPVAAQLENRQPAVRIGAAQILGNIADVSSVEPLVSVLTTDTDKHVRIAAAKALGHIKDPRTVNALIYAARSDEPDIDIREAALLALGEQGSFEAVYFLVRTLRLDFDPNVVDAASVALEQLTGEHFGADHRQWMQWIKEKHPEWLNDVMDGKPNYALMAMIILIVVSFCGLSVYMAISKLKARQ